MSSYFSSRGLIYPSLLKNYNRLKQLENYFLDLEKIFDEKISNEDDLPLSIEINFIRSKYVDLIDLTKGHSESQFSVLQLNCQGLYSSLIELTSMCHQLLPNIIGLCETFLTGQTDSLLDIPGYTSKFLHRKEACRGGLAIYARNEYVVHINNQLSRNVEGIFESLFLELYVPFKKKILIGEIYHQPSGSVSAFMDNTNSDFTADRKPEPRWDHY